MVAQPAAQSSLNPLQLRETTMLQLSSGYTIRDGRKQTVPIEHTKVLICSRH